MKNQILFNLAKEKYLKILEEYVPVVSRVHGGSYPEFYEVQKMYDAIN